MRPLLPTLRERQRYIVYEIITATRMRRDVVPLLLPSLKERLGVLGAARAGLLSVQYDQETQTGILRTTHTSLPEVRAALLMTTHLGRQQVLIRVRGVSGMINKAKRFTEGDHATHAASDDGI